MPGLQVAGCNFKKGGFCARPKARARGSQFEGNFSCTIISYNWPKARARGSQFEYDGESCADVFAAKSSYSLTVDAVKKLRQKRQNGTKLRPKSKAFWGLLNPVLAAGVAAG